MKPCLGLAMLMLATSCAPQQPAHHDRKADAFAEGQAAAQSDLQRGQAGYYVVGVPTTQPTPGGVPQRVVSCAADAERLEFYRGYNLAVDDWAFYEAFDAALKQSATRPFAVRDYPPPTPEESARLQLLSKPQGDLIDDRPPR